MADNDNNDDKKFINLILHSQINANPFQVIIKINFNSFIILLLFS